MIPIMLQFYTFDRGNWENEEITLESSLRLCIVYKLRADY